MSGRLELSDAAIEAMLERRARRADPGDLAQVALDAIWRTPARPARPWDRLAPSPDLASGSARWLWIALAATLALALVGGLLAAGASRLLERPYPLLTGDPALAWNAVAVSGDELWTIAPDYSGVVGGLGEKAMPEGNVPMRLWHYVGDAWQAPIDPPLPDGDTLSGLALGPDGALWVAGASTVAGSDTMVAVLRDGAWRVAWRDGLGGPVSGLAVAPDGTAWVAQGRELVGLRREATGYAARSVTCPRAINRIAATTDGTIYVGGFWYSGGEGLARSDGITCALVDPLGDGQVHEILDLSAGPAGSLLATVLDERSAACPCRWVVMLRGGRWSTISDSTVMTGMGVLDQAIAPDGHAWGIDPDLGLLRYGNGVWRVVAASAHSLALARDGVLWYQTDRGIERIRTDEVGD